MKKDNGITLISLAITIIVLIILAGVTISTIIGDDGILKKSESTKEQEMITMYKQRIDTIRLESKLKYSTNNFSLAKLKNELNEKGWLNCIRIMDNGISKLQLITNDGYMFYATEDYTEYIGKNQEKKDEIQIPTAEEIAFTPQDSSWSVSTVKEALDYFMKDEARIPTAAEISFTPQDSSWHVTTVKEALDYLMNN